MNCDNGWQIELARRAKAGDGAALEVLLNRYEHLLVRLVAPFRGQARAGALEPDDLLQEARRQFIELVREFCPQLNGNLEAYLRTKLRWRIANFLRAERRRRRGATPLEEANLNHLAEEARYSFQSEPDNPRLQSALRRLSPKQRSVIARFYWQEQTVRQIARSLGVTPQAVTALRRRAETALRDEMGSEHPSN